MISAHVIRSRSSAAETFRTIHHCTYIGETMCLRARMMLHHRKDHKAPRRPYQGPWAMHRRIPPPHPASGPLRSPTSMGDSHITIPHCKLQTRWRLGREDSGWVSCARAVAEVNPVLTNRVKKYKSRFVLRGLIYI